MKEFFKKVKSELTIEKVVVRIIMAWVLTSLCFFIKSDVDFATPTYADGINTIMFICYVVLFLVAFCALSLFKAFTWVETFGPTILLTIYGIMSVQSETELSYVFGLMVMLAISIIYAVNKTRTFVEIEKKAFVVAIYVVSALFYMGVVGTTCIFRYLSFNNDNEGFAVIVQMFSNMKSDFVAYTSLNTGNNLAYFLTEFSPVYYLFLPFYMIFPSPITLLVLQILTVISGLIPVYLICRHYNLSKSATCAFSIVYALYPALACGCYTDLHESSFFVPLILWTFYFIEKDKLKLIALMCILLLMVHEDSVIYVAVIGIYLMLSGKKYAKGTLVLITGVVYYGTMVILMNQLGDYEISRGFSNYIVNGEGTLLDVIRNFVVNPAYVIQECFSLNKLQFMLFMFLPVGFMPLCSKKISKYVLFIPMVLINLAPDFDEKFSVFYEYAFGIAALLIYLSISNYADMEEKTKKYLCAVAICASIVFLPTGTLSRMEYVVDYSKNHKQYQKLYDAMEEIPEDASVVVSPYFASHLANRKVVYEYPSKRHTDVIVLDCRNDRYDSRVIKGFKKRGYVVLEEVKDFYVILINKNLSINSN